ncbi:thioredoxin TrxC [Hydrogenovibrio marinus]|uniref:Thioredoxin n=1 Tax=Hydrogenovibrio marinus TaxID=28885 RepID=A0A066ZUP2_HYDMR|nr:thioredoxin TrxC [Hydrogenovibrio marinus]KDN96004.1 thioredoxin [Hydrogenovibrio marinus]BBN58501.1 thiol disulfide reductase thioredoxin [Hydrogenovibrio marinus]
MIIMCPHCGGLNRIPDEKLSQSPSCGKCKQPLFTGTPVEMSGEQLMRAIDKTDQPIVVDFWAPWCGPCKMFAPTFAQAAQQLEPYAKLVKINTEVEQQIAGKFNIRSIPTLAIFKNGKEIARQSGAMPLQSFVQWVKQSI